jgi:capsule polysaccharide export protein KpsE/RkpR
LPAPRSAVSEASPLLRPEASALAGLAGLSPVPGEGRFVALLHSRVLADRIIDRFGLMKAYGAKYRHEARTELAKRTIIQEDRKTSVITISVSDRDPRRAADIADAYASELQKLNAELNTSGAHMERVFLEARVEEVGKELHAAAESLSQFSTRFSILDSQQQPKSTVDAMLKLQGESVAAQAELKGLEQIYTPYSLKVRTAAAKVSELNHQLGEMRGSRAMSEVPADGSLPSIRSLPKLGVTYGELFRKSKLLEAVQLSLTQQLEMAKTEEIKQLPVLRVMDPAEIPELRVFPRRALIVLASALSGLLLGMALVLGGKTWGKLSPDDPIKALTFDARQALSGNAFLQRFDIAERRRMIRQRSADFEARK